MNINFCFRLTPELEMAYNTETGEASSAYCKISVENAKNPPATDEEYAEAHERFRQHVANQLNADIDYVIPISFEEWEENQETEESDDDC